AFRTDGDRHAGRQQFLDPAGAGALYGTQRFLRASRPHWRLCLGCDPGPPTEGSVLMIRVVAIALLALFGCFRAALAQDVSVGTQYDTTHVYVAPDDFKRFVKSLADTFGGTTSPEGEFQVTPTPSKTMSQLVLTPFGSMSVFGFKTPIPYPFGGERT